MSKKITCIQCGNQIDYDDQDCFWDDHGYGYSTKLVRCECGQLNIVKYKMDKWLEIDLDDVEIYE